MAGTQDTPTDPFKHLDKEYYEFEPGQKLFPEPDQQYQLPDEYINDERWLKTVNFIFLDGTIVFKLLTDKTYSLTIKCKTLHSIPDFIRRDRRSARVTQLFLAVNRIKEIPDGMNAFVQLRNCSLDRNKLKSLKNEFGMLTSIENLDIGNNQFKTIPREIFMLKSLKVLRLSVNEIEELPTGFAELKYLENLRIGSNRLRNLPADFGECQSLKYLKLASNRLLEFPTVILKLKGLEQLMISANKIRVLPLELFENEKLQIFHAEGNPLQQPPIEVVNKGLANIREYCQAFKKGDIRDDRLRVLFLGATGAGKTTLCNAIIKGSTFEDPESTVGIEQYPYELRDVKMTLWDFAGQSLYYNTHHVFITSGALVILVINLEKYQYCHDNSGSDEAQKRQYDDSVGFWIDNIAMRVPNAVILVIGTHIDKVEDSHNLMKDIMTRIRDQLEDENKNLQQRIDTLKERLDRVEKERDSEERDRTQRQIESLRCKQECNLQVQFEIPVLVCSKEPGTTGLQKFKDAVVSLALNENLFKERGQTRPSSWKDTERLITEERKLSSDAKESKTGMRNTEDLVKLVIQKVSGMEKHKQVYPVLKYLHSLGEVIWFDEIEDLRELVFINPPVLINIFKMVISDKVDKVLESKTWRELRDCNITKTKFQVELDKFRTQAMINHKLLYMLWRKLPAKESEVEHLVKVLEQFDLCYSEDIETATKPLNPASKDFVPMGYTGTPKSPSDRDIHLSAQIVRFAHELPRIPDKYEYRVPTMLARSPESPNTPHSNQQSQMENTASGHPFQIPFYHTMMQPVGLSPSPPSINIPMPHFHHYTYGSYEASQSNNYSQPTSPQPLSSMNPFSTHAHQIFQQQLQSQHQFQVQHQHHHCLSGNLSPIAMQSHGQDFVNPRSPLMPLPVMEDQILQGSRSGSAINLEASPDFKASPEQDRDAVSATPPDIKPGKKQVKKKSKSDKVYCLFPCHLKNDTPEQDTTTTKDASYYEIFNKFELFPIIPFGFFERFLVHCHREEMEFRVIEIWKNGINVTERGVNSKITKQDKNVLNMETKSKKSDDIQASVIQSNMWYVILKINGLMNKLLQQWPGVRAEIYTLCPGCRSTGKVPYPFELSLPFEKEDTLQFSNDPVWIPCPGGNYCGRKNDYGLVYPIGQVKSGHTGIIQIHQYLNINNCSAVQVGDRNKMRYSSSPEKSDSDTDRVQ